MSKQETTAQALNTKYVWASSNVFITPNLSTLHTRSLSLSEPHNAPDTCQHSHVCWSNLQGWHPHAHASSPHMRRLRRMISTVSWHPSAESVEEDNNNSLAVEKHSAQASYCKFNCDSGRATRRGQIATAGRRKRRIEEEREGEFLDANHLNEMTEASPHIHTNAHAHCVSLIFAKLWLWNFNATWSVFLPPSLSLSSAKLMCESVLLYLDVLCMLTITAMQRERGKVSTCQYIAQLELRYKLPTLYLKRDFVTQTH